MSKSVQNVTSVMLDAIHEEIPEYIYRNKIMIGNYDLKLWSGIKIENYDPLSRSKIMI